MSMMVRGSRSMRSSKTPTRPCRDSETIHPCSTIIASTTRPPASVARRTAVYLRFGTPFDRSSFRDSSGSTFARRLRDGCRECMWVCGYVAGAVVVDGGGCVVVKSSSVVVGMDGTVVDTAGGGSPPNDENIVKPRPIAMYAK